MEYVTFFLIYVTYPRPYVISPNLSYNVSARSGSAYGLVAKGAWGAGKFKHSPLTFTPRGVARLLNTSRVSAQDHQWLLKIIGILKETTRFIGNRFILPVERDSNARTIKMDWLQRSARNGLATRWTYERDLLT